MSRSYDPPRLTDDQCQVLNALIDHIDEQGVPPTWDELMPRLDIVHRSRVQTILKQLEERKIVEKDSRLSSRNLFPLIDPMGRPLGRPNQIYSIDGIASPFADRAEILLRAAVPVLTVAARQLPGDDEREPLLRLVSAIESTLVTYRGS